MKISKRNLKILDEQVKWEYLKFKIQKFMILYSKICAKNNRKIKSELEPKL